VVFRNRGADDQGQGLVVPVYGHIVCHLRNGLLPVYGAAPAGAGVGMDWPVKWL
jgi:hypothetical protein